VPAAHISFAIPKETLIISELSFMRAFKNAKVNGLRFHDLRHASGTLPGEGWH
jgi:hypothetical protein